MANRLTPTPDAAKATQRQPTKTDQLQKLLARPSGAAVTQIEAQLAWQPHTIWAAISRLRAAGHDIKLDQSGKSAGYRAIQEATQ